MYHHICIPTDGSPLSDYAVEQALLLAHALRARVTAVRVTEPLHVFAVSPEQLVVSGKEYQSTIHLAARDQLRAVVTRAHELAVPCETIVVEDEAPYEAIIAVAEQRGCDLIAMASHGRRGIKALVLGSETLKVLTHSTLPVLVYRAED